ncbi:M12 family metallo-peptidase [Flavobacterium sp. XGLA_31]|uniref:M12 family metallo-peptidase n=1 Tax=Flavobacterium sp. XGLA_31 TaxID=3447666 RepID=UPI003F3B8A24
MRKSLLLVMLLSCVSLWAQNKVAQRVKELQEIGATFKPITVLTATPNTIDANVNKTVEGATLATLNTEKISEIVTNSYDAIELEIPYQNQNIALLLYKVNPFAEGFHLDTDKAKNIAYQKGVYYRGIVKGENSSVSSFNFFNGEFNGIFSSPTLGNVVVGKLDKINNQMDYVIYADNKMKVLSQLDCHVKETGFTPKGQVSENKSTLSDRCVTIYFEIDNNLYVENDSNTTTTTNWMTSVFNNVQTLYSNDGISVALKSIFIWTDLDPYEGIGDTSYDYLMAFNANTPVFDGDLGQLVGIDPGGLGGVAVTIDGLCSQNNFSYSDVNSISYATVPTFSWAVQVITHELGHLAGSPHTHGCYWNGNNTVIDGCGQQAGYQEGNCADGPIPTGVGGTIMSYCHLVSGVGINFSNGFGPQPSALVLSTVNNSECLSLDCVNTCINMVVDITVTNISSGSAQISWSDLGSATSWQVAVTPFASSAIVWNTVTSASYSVSGLNPNTYYMVRVRPVCSEGVVAANKEKIFATANTNLCSYVFTDTGGTSNNYTDMENWTRTMMPTGPGLKIKATFTSFNLETDWDYLYIYNGPDESYTDMTSGGLTGTTPPGSFTSTASSGALTFKFVSDQAENRSGWVANITCTGTLGVENNDFLDYSYYPNPTNGKVNITSKDAISEVTVYNVQGQLLYSQKMNALNTTVDIASFAQGTYFFKLKINNQEANFKVLKMN